MTEEHGLGESGERWQRGQLSAPEAPVAVCGGRGTAPAEVAGKVGRAGGVGPNLRRRLWLEAPVVMGVKEARLSSCVGG